MNHAQRAGRLHVCLATLMVDPMAAGPDDVLAAVDAAADIGFDGVSVWTLHHLVATQGDRDRLVERLQARGLASPVVEALAGWANAADEAAVRADAAFAIGVGVALGATHTVAVCLDPELADPEATARNLRLAASMAADAGMDVAVEFLPWTGIPTLRACVELIDRVGADNVGVLLDTWHWARQPGGPDHECLASLDGSLIPVLQVSDTGDPIEDPYLEATTARRLPGDGGVDFDGLFATLRAIGADPLVCPEVFDVASLAASPDSWPPLMADACRQLEARRISPA